MEITFVVTSPHPAHINPINPPLLTAVKIGGYDVKFPVDNNEEREYLDIALKVIQDKMARYNLPAPLLR